MDEAVAYALGHATRNEALSILAEGPRSTSELAKIMDVEFDPLNKHIGALYKAGCIESAGITKRGNVKATLYRTVILPYITDDAYRAMSMQERRDVNGVTTQAILTETLASYRAGKMETDENLWLLWDALPLDAQGRQELAKHNAESYEDAKEIQARAAARMCKSGETGITTIITTTAFERSRPTRPDHGYTPPSKQ
jgi:DNA-binding transcriptional ArsR family regulator